MVEVADTAALMNRALRRATVRFTQPVESSCLAQVPGVMVLTQEPTSIQLQIEGEMDTLIKALAAFPISDFATERPSLEEIFLAYYEDQPVEVH